MVTEPQANEAACRGVYISERSRSRFDVAVQSLCLPFGWHRLSTDVSKAR